MGRREPVGVGEVGGASAKRGTWPRARPARRRPHPSGDLGQCSASARQTRIGDAAEQCPRGDQLDEPGLGLTRASAAAPALAVICGRYRCETPPRVDSRSGRPSTSRPVHGSSASQPALALPRSGSSASGVGSGGTRDGNDRGRNGGVDPSLMRGRAAVNQIVMNVQRRRPAPATRRMGGAAQPRLLDSQKLSSAPLRHVDHHDVVEQQVGGGCAPARQRPLADRRGCPDTRGCVLGVIGPR